MFKQIRDGWNAPRIVRAMKAADSAVTVGEISIAETYLKQASAMIRETTLPRMMHINLITEWGLMGFDLKKRGQDDLSAFCTDTAKLLQARFDAGDFYRENA